MAANTMRRWLAHGRAVCLGGACLLLGGCYADNFSNPGDWAMSAAPRENLAAQTADKSELLTGQGATGSNGVAAAAAVDFALDQPKGDAAGLQAPPKIISFSSSQD